MSLIINYIIICVICISKKLKYLKNEAWNKKLKYKTNFFQIRQT